MPFQYLREHAELLSGIFQNYNENRRRGYCPEAAREEEDIWEVNPPNLDLRMIGKESLELL